MLAAAVSVRVQIPVKQGLALSASASPCEEQPAVEILPLVQTSETSVGMTVN